MFRVFSFNHGTRPRIKVLPPPSNGWLIFFSIRDEFRDRDIFPVNQTEVETFSICFPLSRGYLAPVVVTWTFSARLLSFLSLSPPLSFSFFFFLATLEIFNRAKTFQVYGSGETETLDDLLWIQFERKFSRINDACVATNRELKPRFKNYSSRSIQIEHKHSTFLSLSLSFSLLDLSLFSLGRLSCLNSSFSLIFHRGRNSSHV